MPFSYLLWGEFSSLPNAPSPKKIALRLTLVVEELGYRLGEEEIISALRMITVEALPISHTCGFGSDNDCPELDHDSGNTSIPSQHERAALRVFERIITEFEDMVRAEKKWEQPAKQGAIKLLDAFQDKRVHNDYDLFFSPEERAAFGICPPLDWLPLWVKRLDEEREKLAKEEEADCLTAANEIGLMWCNPPPDDERDEETDKPKYGDVEYWHRRLDEIEI